MAGQLDAAGYHQPSNDAIGSPTGHPPHAGMLSPHSAEEHTLDQGGGASAKRGEYGGMDLAPPELDRPGAARLFGNDAIRAGSAAEPPDAVEPRDAANGVRALDAPPLIEAPITEHGRSPITGRGKAPITGHGRGPRCR
ncbi:hypothetical protein [Actinomadura sp. 9N215]|uniref:hypothetical protein n=1 Tax=Actinomadura sp. 9N215 TaxID=3375150 RepID=UPI00379A498F